MNKVNLEGYENNWFDPGAGSWKRLLWYLCNALFFRSYLLPFSAPKRWLLAAFGAQVGKGVVIKPHVNIKYPWFLVIGDHTWIGEDVWIDNLTHVKIGSHVCLSQGAFLLTGNHHYGKPGFDLVVKPITLEDGVWVGAQALVCPGVTCKSHSVLSVRSVATKDLEAYGVYDGNPAAFKKQRVINE